MFFFYSDFRFEPTYLPNNQLWLDAADTTTITHSTGSVTAWADKSGNGHNATASSGNPVTNATTQNGRNVLDFTSDIMSLPSGLYSIPNGANTLFVVSKRTSEAGTINTTIGMSTTATEQYFHIYSTVAGGQSFTNRAAGGGTVSSTGNTNTAFNIVMMRRSATYQAISVNGQTELLNTSATNVATINSANIGASGAGILPLIGSIAEIILYNRFLTVSEVSTVNRYLSRKWGITIS